MILFQNNWNQKKTQALLTMNQFQQFYFFFFYIHNFIFVNAICNYLKVFSQFTGT